jgi:hypothetical protein
MIQERLGSEKEKAPFVFMHHIIILCTAWHCNVTLRLMLGWDDWCWLNIIYTVSRFTGLTIAWII